VAGAAGGEQGQHDVGADGVEQAGVAQGFGAQGHGVDVRRGARAGVEGQIERREVQGAGLGAPGPHPALAPGVVVEPGRPGGVEPGGDLLDALDEPRQRQPGRVGQHRAHHVGGVFGRQRGGPGHAQPHPVGVDASGVPGGPQLGDGLEGGVGLAEQRADPGAGLVEHRAQLVGAELAGTLAAPAGAVGVGQGDLAGGEGEAGLVVGELAAPRPSQDHGVVRGHRARVDLLEQRAQRRPRRGRGDTLRQRCEHVFEHGPTLAPTPDNDGRISAPLLSLPLSPARRPRRR
jgi:hypothetical protein